MPSVSVIIPCYNQGQFVADAVASVRKQSFLDLEIIIVNDGSTDPYTNDLLTDYSSSSDLRVIITENQGLAAARNCGIAAASGRYILPLDGDDKIEPSYVEKAVRILDQDSEIGIVYSQAILFGAVDSDWNLPEYSLQRMLIDNIIFCSAFFRRNDWLAVGGYDEGMVYGWEDYSFWLSLIELGKQVHQIPEKLFNYRVASDSMVRSKEKWQKIEMFKRIFLRHQSLFSDNIEVWINAILDSQDFYYTSRLYVDTGGGISDKQSISRKIEQGTQSLVFNLGNYTNITSLRFDPVDTFAVVELQQIIIKYNTGQKRVVDQIQCNELYKDAGRLFFDTVDPQCCFPDLETAELEGIVEFSVRLRFVALAESALEYIVRYQKGLIHGVGKSKISRKINQVIKLMARSAASSKK